MLCRFLLHFQDSTIICLEDYFWKHASSSFCCTVLESTRYLEEGNHFIILRALPFFLLGIPGMTFSMTLLIWEETRKFLMNMNSNNGEANWWQRNLMW
jgi:hypothetical protein